MTVSLKDDVKREVWDWWLNEYFGTKPAEIHSWKDFKSDELGGFMLEKLVDKTIESVIKRVRSLKRNVRAGKLTGSHSPFRKR